MESRHNPMIVGITGGPGSGKSTVTRMLAALGAQTADADALVRWAYQDPAFRRALARRYGAGVLDREGHVDRAALARIVFRDEEARRDLERLVHPAVLTEMAAMVEAYRADPERAPMLALEIPLLYEAGADSMVDRVLVVSAPEEAIRARLRERGWDAARIDAVLLSQWPLSEKVKRADDVIETGGTIEETARAVEAFWRRFTEPEESR